MLSFLFSEPVSRLESERRKTKILEDRVEEEKRENLRLETELWKMEETARNRGHDKVDVAVSCNVNGGSSLQQEVESLKVVLGGCSRSGFFF